MRHHKRWKYQNTTLLFLSLIALYYVADTSAVNAFIHKIGEFGYLGAFGAGIFFVSTFTVAPSSVLLFHIAQELSPVIVALCAGAGAVIGDVVIYRFFKNDVFEELRPLFATYGGSHLEALLHTPYFAWLAPVAGALIVASPLPDEAGLALMGMSRMKTWQVAWLSFVLNTVGIFIIVSIAQAF